jgi:hypothetical protein
MKPFNQAFLLFIVFLMACFSAVAYNPYTVTVKSATYDALPGNATVLAGANASLSSPATVSIGFNYKYFGQLADKISINQNGQVSFSNFVQPDFIDAIATTLQPTATSQIAYGVIGTAPSRTLIVEWKNMNIKNAGSGTANTTFHIELAEGSGQITMQYNLAPTSNNENWYNDQYGLEMEIADIYATYDLVFGGSLTAPTETNVAGSSIIKHGYLNAFPASGNAYVFSYTAPAGSPYIKIVSPTAGSTVGHAPIAIWWNAPGVDYVIIKVNTGGNLIRLTPKAILSGKAPFNWTPQWTYFNFDLIVQDSVNAATPAQALNLKFDNNGIDNASFATGMIRLYPNPCNGAANLDLSNFQGDKSGGRLLVHNLLGEVVYSRLLQSEDQVLSITGLKPGLYLLNLQLAGENYSGKLAVEK